MSSSEISNTNIIVTSWEEVPETARKAFKDQKRARDEEELKLKKPRDEEELKNFLSSFRKDRQGIVTQIKEVVLPSIDALEVISSTPPLLVNSGVANLIDTAVCTHMNNKCDAMSQNISNMISSHLQPN